MAVLLDLLFDIVVEHGVLMLGAGALWLVKLGRTPWVDQVERTGCNVVVGLAVLAALVAAASWMLARF
jgi:hypothetical protein